MNGTGHLVCRDLTSLLMSCYSCPNATDSVDPIVHSINGRQDRNMKADSSDTKNRKNSAVTLMTAMIHMKLQLCYFGNMALRSSLSFAVVGSLLLAIVPVIIQKEN